MSEPTQEEISEVMREMGRRGGKIGGKKRMDSMGEKGRSDFARAAVNARWAKARTVKPESEPQPETTAPPFENAPIEFDPADVAEFRKGIQAANRRIADRKQKQCQKPEKDGAV